MNNNSAAHKKIRKQMKDDSFVMGFYKMVHQYDLQKEASEIFERLNPPKDKKGKAIKAKAPEKTDHAIIDDNPLVVIQGKVSEASPEAPKKGKVGRPRKTDSPQTPLQAKVEVPPPKKVGRPPSVKVQAVETAPAPKSNRGRPLCLKVARKKLGYTQAEMAKFLGVSQGLICLIEKKAVPMSDNIETQLRALKSK